MEEDYMKAEQNLEEQGIKASDITLEMIEEEVVNIASGRIEQAMMYADDLDLQD